MLKKYLFFWGITLQILSVQANFPSWEEVAISKVPMAHKQLEIYKKIYTVAESENGNPYNQNLDYNGYLSYFSKPVQGLEVPLKWLYVNAYQRLSDTPFEAKCVVMSSLKKLESLHTHHKELYDTLNQILSPMSFKIFVLDVVDFLDGGDSNKEDVLNTVEKRNNDLVSGSTTHLKPRNQYHNFFSPVFLKKSCLSVATLTYAFLGKGPILGATIVGPHGSIGAHSHRFSNTNAEFILTHDDTHTRDVVGTAKKFPDLFKDCQKLFAESEKIKEKNFAHYEFVQTILHFIWHEFFGHIPDSVIEKNLRDALEIIIQAIISDYKDKLGDSNEGSIKINNAFYNLVYKDPLEEMARLFAKHSLNEAERDFYGVFKTGLNAEECTALVGENTLNNFLDLFMKKAFEPIIPLINSLESSSLPQT